MRAVVYRDHGGPEVLRPVDRERPEPGPGEVRVRVVVSGVNPADWQARAGTGPVKRFPEVVPHLDGAGIVDAVGPGVDSRRIGQRVWLYLAAAGRPTGTAAEFTVVPEARAVPLPDRVGFDVGACLGVPAMTAHRALTVGEGGPARLGPGALAGRVILAAGGAGAVGHAVIQLARWAGATVIATISGPGKARLARAAGAHHVVDYRAADPAGAIRRVAPDGVDLIAEVALGANLELDMAVLRVGGTIAVYANEGDRAVEMSVPQHLVRNSRLQFLVLFTGGGEVRAAAVGGVTAALEAGVLPVGEAHGLPLIRFPLRETAAAHRAVEQRAVGKVLVDVEDGG